MIRFLSYLIQSYLILFYLVLSYLILSHPIFYPSRYHPCNLISDTDLFDPGIMRIPTPSADQKQNMRKQVLNKSDVGMERNSSEGGRQKKDGNDVAGRQKRAGTEGGRQQRDGSDCSGRQKRDGEDVRRVSKKGQVRRQQAIDQPQGSSHADDHMSAAHGIARDMYTKKSEIRRRGSQASSFAEEEVIRTKVMSVRKAGNLNLKHVGSILQESEGKTT